MADTICSILEDAANAAPEKPLFVFSANRWRAEETLTTGQLASRSIQAARAIAGHAGRGDRALLCFSTGPEFWEAFFGCLLSGVTAVPMKIPNLNRPADAAREVCLNCTPSLLITDQATAELLARRAERNPELTRLRVLTSDVWRSGSMTALNETASPALPNPGGLAYLQYSSGSTLRPKGIRISHANLLANLQMICDRMEICSGDAGVTWLPHYHDMGLVGSYLTSLYSKNTTWCLSPEEFAVAPSSWLKRISGQQATISGAPDFAYRLCAEKMTDEEISGLNLTSWRVAYVGAERVRAETLRRFAERFGSCGFRELSFFPCYGLAEATLLVSGGPAAVSPVIRRISATSLKLGQIQDPVSDADTVELVGSGQVFGQAPVAIGVSGSGQQLVENRVGEILVSGAAVTAGYFHEPDSTVELFRELTSNGVPRLFLRTGDLGFISNGELFITGREKELIIIRGRNLYPEDLEESLNDLHDALQPAASAAFSVERDGDEQLIVACELRRGSHQTEAVSTVISRIREAIVSCYGVSPREILLLRYGSIPRTSSGKVKRLEVRSLHESGAIDPLFRDGGNPSDPGNDC